MKPVTPIHSLDDVRRRFLAACESSSSGPPDVDSFLAPFDFEEPERSVVRGELESIRSARTVTGGGDGTVDTTLEHVVPQLDRTMDHVAQPDGTMEHVPQSEG